jgi:membrane-bound lytic murein transglycosylase B
MNNRYASLCSVCFVATLLAAHPRAGTAQVSWDPDAVEQSREAFIDRVVAEHDLDAERVSELLGGAAIIESILAAISRPAERVVPWYDYRNIFLTEQRITDGAAFWHEYADVIESTAQRFGVDPHVVVAIIGVETFYGTRMGSYRVVDALSTLAFAYPPRADFFAGELESFLLLDREEGYDLAEATGSYAGAMGAGQFIPSSFREYAVDGNGDGRRDLWRSWDDILASVSNYLARHGWRAGESVAVPARLPAGMDEPRNQLRLTSTVGELRGRGVSFEAQADADAPADIFSFESSSDDNEYWAGFNNFYVITRYNRSTKYALAVVQLAEAIRETYMTVHGGPLP